jgi:hypothetical protein
VCLFVAFYDSQGHGGSALTRLHTGNSYSNVCTFYIVQTLITAVTLILIVTLATIVNTFPIVNMIAMLPHTDDYENYCLLRCGVVYFDINVPTSRRNLFCPGWRWRYRQ